MEKELEKKKRIIILDCETNGIKATKVHCIVCKDIHTNEIFRFVETGCYLDFIRFFETEVGYVIGHNVIGFDIPTVLVGLLGLTWKIQNTFDTYVGSRLSYSDRFTKDIESRKYANDPKILRQLKSSPHSLESWGIRVGRYKPQIEQWDVYTPEMLKRCEEDVEINHLVYKELLKELKGFSPYSIRLEMRVAAIIDEQCKYGAPIDREATLELLKECSLKADVLREEITREVPPMVYPGETILPKIKVVKQWDGTYEENEKGRKVKVYKETKTISSSTKGYKELKQAGYRISGPYSQVSFERFNPDSPDQRLMVLEKAGWKPVNFNKPTPSMLKAGRQRGNPKTTDERNLETIPKDAPSGLRKLADYTILTNRAMLADQWLKLSDNKEGRIYGYVDSIGTPTGRMRHSEPNLANIPSVECDKETDEVLKGMKGLYGWECRRCFTVSDKSKYVMVGFDAASLEVRMLAHYMNDEAFIFELLNGDIYVKVQEALGLPTRKKAKEVMLAMIYGAGDAKLGVVVGSNAKAGSLLREKLLTFLPKLRELINKVQLEARTKGYLVGLDGRKLWVRKPHAALNTLLQSAGAIVMKQFLITAYKRLKAEDLDFQFLLNVHDEAQLQTKVEDVSKVSGILLSSIRDSGIHFRMNIVLDGNVKVGGHWGQCH